MSAGVIGRALVIAVRAMVVLTIILGVGYTLLVTGIGQLAFPSRANGAIIQGADGRPVGSSLIGQAFTGPDGRPLARYFQSRPSAAVGQTTSDGSVQDPAGYDGELSAASNLGPENPTLISEIKHRKAEIAAFNGVPESAVPADAVTASGSGLDPDISPAYALLQVDRVAAARGLAPSRVHTLVESHVQGRVWGYLGEPRVNVLQLNLALDALTGQRH